MYNNRRKKKIHKEEISKYIKIHKNIKIKENANQNHIFDSNKIKGKNKKIVIIGVLMLRDQRPKFLSKNKYFVNLRLQPDAATEDIVDIIKPVLRKKN